MIEIITDTGISLDLCEDDEFQIEYESPFFADEHIPVPYSTEIGFLPTKTNCSVFGYIPLSVLEPNEKEVAVTIYVSGFSLLIGKLVWQSVEDGRINYSFSGKGVEDNIGGYVHELPGIVSRGQRSGDGIVTAPDYPSFGECVDDSREEFPSNGFSTPLIVCAAHTGKTDVDLNIKYRNWKGKTYAMFCPVVYISDIFKKNDLLKSFQIAPSLSKLFNALGILGQYTHLQHWNGFEEVPATKSYPYGIILNPYNKLPTLSCLDLLKNLCGILCATVWKDGAGYSIKSNSEIISSQEALDWDEIVADSNSLSREDGASYRIEFNNSTDSKEVQVVGGSGIISKPDYSSALVAASGAEIQTFKIESTKDIVALKNMKKDTSSDIVSHYMGYQEKSVDGNSEEYVSSSDFNLIKCTPVQVNSSYLNVVPVIDFPEPSDQRPSEVFIGVLRNGQFTDKADTFGFRTADGQSVPITESQDKSLSLCAEDLRDGLHKEFAEWIESDRIAVSVDLNLSPLDLINLKLWKKVYFRNHEWLIRKLSVSINVRSGKLSSTGEFVSVR